MTTPVVAPPSKAIKLFGREPAALLGIIEAVLAALVAFSLGVTNESAGLIAAVISLAVGAYTAWATRDTLLGYATGLAKAIIMLVVYYGVTLTDGQIAAVVTLVPLLVGFWQRGQTSPVASPVDPSPTQVTQSPVGVAAGDVHLYSGDSKTEATYHGQPE